VAGAKAMCLGGPGDAMKPAPFDYHAPRTAEEAVALLAAHGDDAKILAGGQSLVPAMNFRLARPAVLVDINRIAELDFCETTDGALRIGALTRHVRFDRPVTEGALGALLADVVRYVAHLPIRVRGTFAGSLAHADPAAEWCLVATTLDAEIRARGPDGERSIEAAAFFRSILTTPLRPDELIAEVRLPLLGPAWRFGFAEFSRRAGDFALSMALAVLRMDGERIAEARVGVGGAGDRPVRIADAEQALQGAVPGPDALAEAGAIAAARVDPFEDLHASIAYRRDLVQALTRRALERALAS
jgi:aerobic carbon-monoxide dehydrogenase medium subunit